MNINLIGMFAFFAAYAINRFVMTEAIKKLDDSDRLKIFEVFSKRNNYSTILVLAFVFLYFGALQYLPHFIVQLTITYLTLFCAYLIFRFVSNYKKLKQIIMPATYIRSFTISYSIFLLGFLILVICVLWDWRA